MTNIYICDKNKHIKDGLCNERPAGCMSGDNCYLTTQKEYAKEYIDIYEAKKWFEEMATYYDSMEDTEKTNQYRNAIKGVEQSIKDIQEKHENSESVIVAYLIPQTDSGTEEMVETFNDKTQ